MRLSLKWILFFSTGLLSCGFDELPRRAPEIRGATVLNAPASSKLSLKSLRGRVVLIAFWNPDNTGFENFVATLKAWYSQYRFRGLQIIAVYVPGWDTGKKESSASDLAKEYAMEFPVTEDRDASVRVAYSELMSPALFCIDRKGMIRGEWSGIFDMKHARVMLEALLQEVP
jgi:peroxiredoxin